MGNTTVFIKMHLDYSTEGNETMTFNLRVGNHTGPIISSYSTTIQDTSTTIPPVYPSWPLLQQCTIDPTTSYVEVHTPLNSVSANATPFTFDVKILNPNARNVTDHWVGENLEVTLEFLEQPGETQGVNHQEDLVINISKEFGGTIQPLQFSGIVGFLDERELTWKIKITTTNPPSQQDEVGTSNRIVELKLIRDPYVLSFDPVSGTTTDVETDITVSGAEPNSPFWVKEMEDPFVYIPGVFGHDPNAVAYFDANGVASWPDYFGLRAGESSRYSLFWIKTETAEQLLTFWDITSVCGGVQNCPP
jgi:hypothetical protein